MAAVVTLVIAGAPVAEALQDDRPGRARLTLSVGAAFRDSRQSEGGLEIASNGFSPTQARLAFAYFFGALPLGVAAETSGDWFVLRGNDLENQPTRISQSALRGSLALAGRWTPGFGFSAELHLGYAVGQLAAVDGSSGAIRAAPLLHHGPILAAVLGYDPGRLFALSLRGLAAPVTLSAGRLAQYAVGLELALGRWSVASFQLAGLLDYQLSVSQGRREELTLSQTAHRVGLGLRLRLPQPPLALTAQPEPSAPEAPPVAEVPVAPVLTPPSGPGSIRGLARAASGAGVAATIEASGAPAVQSGADGRFVIAGVGPGPVMLKVRAAGFKPLEEAVSVPPGGEATLELTLEKLAAKPLASVRGLVRTRAGAPVHASVSIREAGLSTIAGEGGRFIFRLPGGKYTVVIEAAGYVGQTKQVEVADGDEAIFHCDLEVKTR